MSPEVRERFYARAKALGIPRNKLHGQLGRAVIELPDESVEFHKADEYVTLAAGLIDVDPGWLRTGVGGTDK